MTVVDKRHTAWVLSRRFHLAPTPIPGEAKDGDRLDIAWDGQRVLACRVGEDVRLSSADGRDWTKDLAAILRPLRKLDVTEAVFDAFVCALDAAGKPSFEVLRDHVATKSPARMAFVVWDMMFQDGVDLTAEPLTERAKRLAALFANAKEPLVLSQPLEGTPRAVVRSLGSMGVRGIVCRDPKAPYGQAPRSIAAGEPIAWERSLSGPPAVTNQDKVLYPRDGITKADIVAYYADIAEPILRVMRDRPLVCQRWPDGIDDFTWYQHRMPPRAPDYLRAVWIDNRAATKKDRRVVIESREGLAWMVNQAALTFHGWSSRVASLDSPDWVILDLDPGESTRWETVIDVALAIRKLLEMLELPSFPKTSGQKGLHVLIPIAPGHTAAQTHELAMRIARLINRLYPNDVSLEPQTESRRGRLYLDHLQSYTGKSLVLPYSLRAVDGAPASTPLTWSEVTRTLSPRAFTLRTMRARLDKVGDLAAPLTQGTTQLAGALGKLHQG